ncbi:DNA mismatch repair protein MutS [Croceibacterium mercuriale]|uniref:DNA mismatch repair protein MutS n=1 Tax=Croceibacterium mercuriale TaxID=1572751 RepID=A0A0B2BXF9_9SPHN|nr:Smr/MutS family protein [Croceibacterium mercuriale]KHL24361.1 DNA mismatch repair protein MutS [Croceibacterium mercuriale]
MPRPPRGLSADEQALWSRLARSVTPLPGRALPPEPAPAAAPPPVPAKAARKPAARVIPAPPQPDKGRVPPLAQQVGLDSSWERRLAKAAIAPDFTIDLHGHTLDQAYDRLHLGLGQARVMGARLVLLVTGRPRPVEAADRGTRRGAIRAKVLDWLAAGPHASDVVAIRAAHRRHGGDGALYLVLRRSR